jgi:hypothetical protein
MMKISTPNIQMRQLRRVRSSRFRPSLDGLPFRSSEPPAWRRAALVVVPLAVVGVGVLAYAARRRMFQGLAIIAEAVEEAADAIEDAAEDLAEAARARADGGE